MNQNEVNLILSRLESIESNQISSHARMEKWINKIEDNYSLLANRFDKRLDKTNERVNKIGVKVAGLVAFFGMSATFFGAWINKKFFG